ncbi:SIMPL domain-containing protein [Roseivirga sp.]|uniref:SIMPL domain-containing protein n=1 Tax=Roseivirga sp. TaxID=1964215 RepID=UPI003B515CC7
MKKQILILALLLVVAVVQAQDSKNFIDQNYIEVTGVAYKEVVPDEIFLTVEINEKDNKGKESLERLERDMLAKLKSLGINTKEDVMLNDLTSNFKFYFLKKTDIFSSKEYTVKVNNAALAGKVISGLSEIGISNIGLNRVEYSKLEELKLEVKRMAILNAKGKANMLVEALDQQLGKALHIQEFDNPRVYRPQIMEMKVRDAESWNPSNAATPEFEFDKIRIDATIQVKFAID